MVHRIHTQRFRFVATDHACGGSHAGGRPQNEDAMLVLSLKDASLLAVADGLGGHSAGEEAARIAVDVVRAVMEDSYQEGMDAPAIRLLLTGAYREAHRKILEEATSGREGMGTTLVTALAREGTAVIANTGDSRAYVIGRGIAFVTKDHSLVRELVDRGEISPETARRHPLRHIVTRALGLDFGLDLYEVDLAAGGTLLLTSDGIHDYVEDAVLVSAASRGDCSAIVHDLLKNALGVTQDNVTVVVYRPGRQQPPGRAG
ncbi:MAG: protein phosphatase 2C domain-containing protein [Methanomicrobiales archaeon]|nr:protein phosphatase 2C domain-containing protein [Methanomicrobiales archaeon]MDI6876515.1 protein phosphatase 2C domain-containing protein [Methanomicrobiales archaeon]